MKTIQASVVVAVLTILPGCGVLGSSQGTPGPQGIQGERGADGAQGPPGFPVSPSTQSGERVKAVYLTSDDGAKAPIGWLDANTSLRCEFVMAGDGFIRCLPVVPRSALVRVFYTSDDCTGVAVAVGVEIGASMCSPMGPYVEDMQHVACGAGLEVYSVGSKFTGEEPSYFSDGVGCLVNIGTKYDFSNVSRIEPTTFVGSSTKMQ
jgi:hypothetical protein